MKKLTKVKLINWHLFSNVTLDIRENSLITGDNGAGKTTLLDAIQYLLIGGKGGTKFNIAANTDGKRTLENYVRGKTGEENREYIREGDVIAHICLEYFDELTKEYSLIGSILELPRGGKLIDRFYFLEYLQLNDDIFIDGNMPRDYKSMKAYFKNTLFREFKIFETVKAYREQISRFFGIDSQKYAKLLPKALAFKPIDLKSFVNNFLLDDEEIDVTSLKNNFANLKQLEERILIDKEKLEKLERISVSYTKLEDFNQIIRVNQLLEKINIIENAEEFLKNCQDEIKKIDLDLTNLQNKKEEINKLRAEKDNEILNLERSKDSNEFNNLVSRLNNNLTAKRNEYEKVNANLTNLYSDLDAELLIYEALNAKNHNKHFNAFVDYIKKNNKTYAYNVNTLNNIMLNVSNEKTGLLNSSLRQREKLDEDKLALSENIRACKIRLENLNRNEKVFTPQVTNLIAILSEELAKVYNKKIYVTPLCDLIEVNDEAWRNACEGQLGNARFNIIVEPEYFDKALEIYDKNRVNLNIFGVGLVNTSKLDAYDTYKEGSLASKIDSNNKHARRYVNMLLSNVVAVDNLSELKNYPRSITKTCMTYANYTAMQLNPRTYQTPYIGLASNDIQIAQEQKEIEEGTKKLNLIYLELEGINKTINLLKTSNIDAISSTNRTRYIDNISSLTAEIKELENQKANLGENLDLNKIELELEKLREAKTQLEESHNDIIADIRTCNDKKASINQSILDSKATTEVYIKERDRISKESPELISLANKKYNELVKTHKHFNAIRLYIESENKKAEDAATKSNQEVINAMNEYNFRYSFNSEPLVSNINEYEKERKKIRDHELVNYELEAQDLKNKIEKSFKEDFINKLRSSIDAAQNLIDDINMALDNKSFGTDTYRLVISASKEEQFKNYYNIVMKSIPDEQLFTESISKRNQNMLDELFKELMNTTPENEKIAYRYLDYRSYIECDIEISKVDDKKKKFLFSNVASEKSGGETESPFYIVIAAAFQTLLSKNKRADSGCIVLFDEAFSKMDSGRIGTMLNFYNSLSIQIMIATPPNKLPDIHQHVNTKLVVIRDNDNAIIYPFYQLKDLNKLGFE